MNHYKVIMTDDAVNDLEELCYYIANELKAPQTALSYLQTIRTGIEGLQHMPERTKTVDDEPWHSRGIRKILIKNSFVYYWINNETLSVYILNIIYTRRDQLNALGQIDPAKN